MHEELCGEPEDSAVHSFRNYGVITRTKKAENGVNRGHPGSKYVSALPSFQFCDRALESLAIGMLGARVVEALVFTKLRLHICGSLVDGRDNSAGSGIRFLSHMNRVGGETHRCSLASWLRSGEKRRVPNSCALDAPKLMYGISEDSRNL